LISLVVDDATLSKRREAMLARGAVRVVPE
jgi:hypothetical protein